MIFTDDDLKRLKEWIVNSNPRAIYSCSPDGKDLERFAALIRRLEAAEKVVDRCVSQDRCFEGFKFNGLTIYDRWRKAAGKPDGGTKE